MINISAPKTLTLKKSALKKVIETHPDENTVNEYREELHKLVSLDFEVPIFEGGVWKVREQLQPESRGYKLHKFESDTEAWAFYESK
jgi:hypothetical protein